MPAASPVPPAVSSEEWEFLEWNVLKPSRSSSVCITCPIQQGLIPQGEAPRQAVFSMGGTESGGAWGGVLWVGDGC